MQYKRTILLGDNRSLQQQGSTNVITVITNKQSISVDLIQSTLSVPATSVFSFDLRIFQVQLLGGKSMKSLKKKATSSMNCVRLSD